MSERYDQSNIQKKYAGVFFDSSRVVVVVVVVVVVILLTLGLKTDPWVIQNNIKYHKIKLDG